MMSTMERILYLKQLPLFGSFAGVELSAVAQIVEEVEAKKNEIVFEQGDYGDALYLIVEGRVAVIQSSGGKQKTLAIMGENECFGEMAILTDEQRSATIQATEPSRFLRVSRDDFRALIFRNPEMAFPLFNILATRIRRLSENQTKGGQ